jgi:hypothetical protein
VDDEFVVRFTADMKRRVQAHRERTRWELRAWPLITAVFLVVAVLSVVAGVTMREPKSLLLSLPMFGLAAAPVVFLRKEANRAPLPLPDVAVRVRGDELWLAGHASASGKVRRAAETWSLSATTVTLGTAFGAIPAVVFSAPDRKPRSYLLTNLDQSGEEILAQIEFRKSKVLR